jgi:hypothetical protein
MEMFEEELSAAVLGNTELEDSEEYPSPVDEGEVEEK